jgi:hypothetical protein
MRNMANGVGIGCFGGSETLGRVFRKAFEDFMLGRYEDICPPADRILSDVNLTRLFRSVITLGSQKPDQMDRASEWVPASAKITGFFLGLNKQNLHLIVFFRGDDHQPAKFITRLEKFTRLRKTRLH